MVEKTRDQNGVLEPHTNSAPPEPSNALSRRALLERDGALPQGWSGAVWLDRTLEGLVALSIIGELVVVLLNVFSRAITGNSVLWTQEASHFALLMAAFVGGAIAYPKGAHMAVRAVVSKLPAAWRPYQAALVDWMILVMGAGSAYYFIPVLTQRWDEKTPIMRISSMWLSIPMAVGLILICWFAIYRLLLRRASQVFGAMGAVAALIVVAALLQPLVSTASTHALLACILSILFVLLLIGIPIAFVLALASALYIYWGDFSAVSAVPLAMESGAKGFLLLAIPFFILAGAIMNWGGLMTPLARLFEAWIGHFRGGLLQVIVPSTYVFSGISGSKVADVAAVGTSMRDMLDERKYPRGEVVAVLSASAIMGETIPPSLVLLVIGSITSLSTAALFAAGLLPAVVLAVCVVLLIYFRARKLDITPSPRATWRVRFRSVGAALPVAALPLGLVVGILLGWATPTEVSALAAGYGFIVTAAYRRATRNVLWETLRETATTGGMILFIIAAAAPFSQALSIGGAAEQIGELMSALHGSKVLFLLLSVVVLIIMGQILEGLPAVLIFVPILMPSAVALGIDPIQYSMILIVAMGLGSFAPPAGIGFYVASAVGRESMERSIRHFYPYLLALGGGLVLIAAVPWFSTILPTVLGLT